MIEEFIDERIPILIPKAFGKYRYIRRIGSGAFSVVILVENTKTSERFACKIVSREHLVQEKSFERFEQELRLLQTFDNPNIIKIYDIVYEDLLIFMVMEYCSNSDLFSCIVQNGVFSIPQTKIILWQIARALVYLHGRHIAHRDIKPENILLDDFLNPKLADFGLCHETSNKQLLMTPCGSPFYAPPEVVSNSPYEGEKGDMWSLGVVLFTMLTGALPWNDVNQAQLIKQIITGNFSVPLTIPTDLRKLIIALMSVNPGDRPTASDVYKLEWLANIPSVIHFPKSIQNSRARSMAGKSFSKNIFEDSNRSYVHKKRMIVRPEVSDRKNRMSYTFDMTPVVGLVRKIPPSSHSFKMGVVDNTDH